MQYRYVLKGPRDLVKEPLHAGELSISDAHPILAQTLYSTISKGTELSAWKGLAPIRAGIEKYPRLMGYCNLAKVVEVDCKNTSYRVGDIILTGREHCTAFTTSENQIFLKVSRPESDGLHIYSGLYLAHIAYDSLQNGNFRSGHKVAIIGFGILGYLVAALVQKFGSVPTCYTSKHKFQKHAQCASFKFAEKDFHSEVFNEEYFDIVVNTSDSWDDYLLSLHLARKGGKIVNIGFPGRGQHTPEWNPLEPQFLYSKQLTLSYCGYTPDLDVEPIDYRFTKKRNLEYLASLLEVDDSFLDFIYLDTTSANDLDLVYNRLNTINDFGTVMLKWKT